MSKDTTCEFVKEKTGLEKMVDKQGYAKVHNFKINYLVGYFSKYFYLGIWEPDHTKDVNGPRGQKPPQIHK